MLTLGTLLSLFVVQTLLIVAPAYGQFDPLSVYDELPSMPAAPMLEDDLSTHVCDFGRLGEPLSLYESVNRALCRHPQTRQSWANIKLQAAQVGVSKASYLPTVTGTTTLNHALTDTQVQNKPSLGTHSHVTNRNAALNLAWVLLDFGLRAANLENARQLLEVASENHLVTLHTVFLNTAQAYYDVWSSQMSLHANLEAEKFAKESYQAAQRKYEVGVGTLNDKLQAETAYAQATLNRVKAEGVLKSAQGTLATSMGLPSTTQMKVDPDVGVQPDVAFERTIEDLLKLAQKTNPKLLAAQAQLRADKASIDSTYAAGMPILSLTGNLSRNGQIGQLPNDTFIRGRTIGLQLSIPLFEGMGRLYKVQAARAQADLSQVVLDNTNLQVELEVWKDYQNLRTQTESLKASNALQQSAHQAYRVSLIRYQSGVGNILDLLNAQSALANAQQQIIQAQANWRLARLNLAASLGQLGQWMVQDNDHAHLGQK